MGDLCWADEGVNGASLGRRMRIKTVLVVLALSLMNAGCAETNNQEAAMADDPLEPMNRFFFDFNQRLDRHAALPAATFYTDNVPRGIRVNVHNFLLNMGGPVNVVNDMLIGEFTNAGEAGARFVINTTRGRGGLFRRRHRLGLSRKEPRFRRDIGRLWRAARALSGAAPPRPHVGAGFFRQLCRWLFLAALFPFIIPASTYVGLVHSTIGSVDNRSANIVTYPGYRAGLGRFLRHHAGSITASAANARSRTRRPRPRNFPTFRTGRNGISRGHVQAPFATPIIERIVTFSCRRRGW